MQLYAPLLSVSSFGTPVAFFRGVLPLPPSVNKAHTVRRGNIASRYDLIAFQQQAAYLLPSQSWIDKSVLAALRRAPAKTPLIVHFNFYFPDTRSDVDNRIKYAQDACFNFLSLNDRSVRFVSAVGLVDAKNPRCEVEISCFEGMGE